MVALSRVVFSIDNGLNSFWHHCWGVINQSLVAVTEIWHTHTHRFGPYKFLALLLGD